MRTSEDCNHCEMTEADFEVVEKPSESIYSSK